MNSLRSILKRTGRALMMGGGTVELPYSNYPSNEVYFWRPKVGLNFGDYLAYVVVERILAAAGRQIGEEVAVPRRLLTIGSVLHFANSGDVVWGSGINGKVPLSELKFRSLDVRAVRGPITREILRRKGVDVPEVYGDPALLLTHLFPGRFLRQQRRDWIVIPNLHDLPLINDSMSTKVVSPLRGWNVVVDAIAQSGLVISSSLHGVVLAEALGVPVRYVRLSETENILKYNDYAAGTGRSSLPFASSIEEALEMGGMTPLQYDTNKLLSAFPLELWPEPRTAQSALKS